MNDTELELIIKKAVNIIRKKQPGACLSDIEDAVTDRVARFLELNGSLDKISVSWLTLAGERRLIDHFRRQSRNVSLEQLSDAELTSDDFVELADLKCDNPDLAAFADSELFPWLETEDSDEAA